MRNHKFKWFFSFLIIFSFQNVYSQTFIAEYSDSRQTLTLQNEQVKIKSGWVSPTITPGISKGEWKFIKKRLVRKTDKSFV